MESGQELDWKNLGFGYHPTDYNVRCYYRDGKWGEWEVSSSDMITIPMASTCLHYGQQSFEGLKAFRGKDGKVRIFRPEENAARMQHTSRGILMPELPTERFLEALDMVLRLNKDFDETLVLAVSIDLELRELAIDDAVTDDAHSRLFDCSFVLKVG